MANTPARATRADDAVYQPAKARAEREGSDLSAETRWFWAWLASPELDVKQVRSRYRDWERKTSEGRDTLPAA